MIQGRRIARKKIVNGDQHDANSHRPPADSVDGVAMPLSSRHPLVLVVFSEQEQGKNNQHQEKQTGGGVMDIARQLGAGSHMARWGGGEDRDHYHEDAGQIADDVVATLVSPVGKQKEADHEQNADEHISHARIVVGADGILNRRLKKRSTRPGPARRETPPREPR